MGEESKGKRQESRRSRPGFGFDRSYHGGHGFAIRWREITEALESGDDAGALRRREKRQFVGACFFAALLVSAYGSALIFCWRTQEETLRMKASSTSAPEINRLHSNFAAVMNVFAFWVVVAFLGFVFCLVNWLSARRLRGREEAGQKP